jgi:hypothetical protein
VGWLTLWLVRKSASQEALFFRLNIPLANVSSFKFNKLRC